MKLISIIFLIIPGLAFAELEVLPQKKVDCIEVCLQERGANNYKTVSRTERQCLASTVGNADMRRECRARRKQMLRNLEFNDLKVCNRKCG